MFSSNLNVERHGRKQPMIVGLCVALAILSSMPAPTLAMSGGPAIPLGTQARDSNADIVHVRAFVHGGRAVVGPRGGAVVHRGAAVVRPRGNVGVRNRAVVVGRGGWARPGWYRWPVGGALAAGAAVGFVTAATAAAWAGAAPAPGMCWYYTDPSRTQGFWDYCPR